MEGFIVFVDVWAVLCLIGLIVVLTGMDGAPTEEEWICRER